jgi:DNA-binding GntR family transcriptional regulator
MYSAPGAATPSAYITGQRADKEVFVSPKVATALESGAIQEQTGVLAIADRLRASILDGELAPNAVATQVELAERLAVSRTPLREALRMLEIEGLIVREPNRRFRIAGITLEDLEELYMMRISLEVMALRITLPQLTNADHAELEGWLAQMERFVLVGDWRGLEEPHRAFHAKPVSQAGPRIEHELAGLWDHAQRYRNAYAAMYQQGSDYSLRQAEHRQLLDAIESGDLDAATRALSSHYARTAIDVAGRAAPGHPMNKVRAVLAAYTGSTELAPVPGHPK